MEAAAILVLILADQALMQLTAEQGDAARTDVVAKPVAGHADLPTATRPEHAWFQEGPALAVSSSPSQPTDVTTFIGPGAIRVGDHAAAA